MKNQTLITLTLAAAAALMSACGGGTDLPGPTTPSPPVTNPPTPSAQYLSVSGADTSSFGTQLDMREFGASRASGSTVVAGLMATSLGVLHPRFGAGGVPVQADPLVIVTTSASTVSVSVSTQNGTRLWSYATACSDASGFTPCPNISFDAANRRVTFTNMQVQNSSARGSLATAPITISGSLQWSAADE